MRRYLHAASIKQPETDKKHGHDAHYDRSENDEKLKVAQFRFAGDHDVGRIANQGGRSSDVGRDRLYNQKRHRVQAKPLRDGQRHRGH